MQPSDTPPVSPAGSLLSDRDAAPFSILNPSGRSHILLTVEHAGRAVPSALGDLGIPASEMERHIAWDIGAAALGGQLSALLDAPLLCQPYSRLVIDSNRPLDAPDLVPEVSDGTLVPANCGLSDADRCQRYDEIHQPFHHAVSKVLDERAESGTPTLLVSLHSFTKMLAVEGRERPWKLGILHGSDARLAEALMNEFAKRFPAVCCAFNEPYTIDYISDYSVPVHGEARGLPNVLLEIRNDEIADAPGRARWASMLAAALSAAAESLAPMPVPAAQQSSPSSPES